MIDLVDTWNRPASFRSGITKARMTARQFFGAIFLVLFVGCWAGGIGTWFQMLRHSRSRNGIAWTARELTPTGSRFWKQWWMLWIAALVTGALSMLLLSGV